MVVSVGRSCVRARFFEDDLILKTKLNLKPRRHRRTIRAMRRRRRRGSGATVTRVVFYAFIAACAFVVARASADDDVGFRGGNPVRRDATAGKPVDARGPAISTLPSCARGRGAGSGSGSSALRLTWNASAHASVYATPLVEDARRDGRGAVLVATTSGRIRAYDGITGGSLEGRSFGGRHGRASRAGLVRVGERWLSVALDAEARLFDDEGTKASARIPPLKMALDWYNSVGIERGDRSGERPRRALMSVEDDEEEEESPALSAEEEERIERGWKSDDQGKETNERRRVIEGKDIFIDPHVLCTPVVGDVDGDGEVEIVAAVSYYFASADEMEDDVDVSKYMAVGLVVLDGETLETKLSVHLDSGTADDPSHARAYASPNLVDVNADGRLDIVIGTSAGSIHVIDGKTGRDHTGWPKYFGEIEAQIVVVDADANGELDLVACDTDGNVAVFKTNGDELWTSQVHARVSAAPTVGDVDGDGSLEVVIGTSSGAVYVMKAKDGSTLPGWPVYASDKIMGSIVLTQMQPNVGRARNKRKGLDLIIASHDGVVNVLDGGTKCSDAVDVGANIYATPIVSSLSGFDSLDLVVATMDGGIHAFEARNAGFNPLLTSTKDHMCRHSYFGIVLQDREYRVIRGDSLDVTYEVIDRRQFDRSKSKKASMAPYEVEITVTSLDGYKKTVSRRHNHVGRYSVRVSVPLTKTRGEIRVVVRDTSLVTSEDAYSVSFHEDYEVALKWLVVVPFLLASAVVLQLTSRDVLDEDLFGSSSYGIPTSTIDLHEE